MLRSRAVLACVFGLLLAAANARAAPMTAYSKEAFAAAQAAGEPIVVYVHASW